MLLVVAKSSGSSPGRAGYKMAVAADGALCGSIGGGVMEVRLVKNSRAILSKPGAVATGPRPSTIIEQVHQKNSPAASGMICSGKQTVIEFLLNKGDVGTVNAIVQGLEATRAITLTILPANLGVGPTEIATQCGLEVLSDTDFVYTEHLGPQNHLFIIGGGHCALALSEMMSRLDFRIAIFDDRPRLNTIEKNRFAHDITMIDGYNEIGDRIPNGDNIYVVVMTLGYKSDEIVIRSLLAKDFRYFGVLGSKAKMKTLVTSLEMEGFDKQRLNRIHTPIGLPINSHTPEEIAVSIAAEIISVKNIAEPLA